MGQGGQQNKLYYVIPKSSTCSPNMVGSHVSTTMAGTVGTTKTMILNGKEAKTVLLSSTGSAGGGAGSHPVPQGTPIVVLNQNGHPNPMQLLPVFSSNHRTVTSVAAARPIKVTEEFNSTSEVRICFRRHFISTDIQMFHIIQYSYTRDLHVWGGWLVFYEVKCSFSRRRK